MKRDRRLWIRVVALMLALLLVLGVAVSAVVAFAGPADPGGRDIYRIDIYYDEIGRSARVNQVLTYTNRTGATLDSLSFLLYPNAFRSLATVPIEADGLEDAFPGGYAPGGVDFVSVKVNGQPADWGVSGVGEQFLRVAAALPAGATAEFELVYAVLLPPCGGAFGADALSVRLVDCYPVAAAYDPIEEAFALYAGSAVGEPRLRDMADYRVTLNAPATYRLASTGAATQSPAEGDRTLWTIEAAGSRDFAAVLGRKYTAHRRQAGDVALTALTNDASIAAACLDYAADALAVYQGWLGVYPFSALDIAQVDALPGGVGRTGLILLDEEALYGDRAALRLTVARLVARQYFSSAVGSDQAREPWLSEALSAVAALLYLEERDGRDAYLAALNAQVLDALNLTLPGGLYVDSAASRFTSGDEYQIIVVDRGVAAMHELIGAMGRDAFLQALGRYVADNIGRNASIAGFAAALNASGGRWDEYLMEQLHNIGGYAEQGIDWLE
ncbi:MAG: M1 family metallopeptidase [Clostridiales bacterium]|nr:M1 family metallopeptidase [Clostridiales bacterium]